MTDAVESGERTTIRVDLGALLWSLPGVDAGERTIIRVDDEFDAAEWLVIQNDEAGEMHRYRRVGGDE